MFYPYLRPLAQKVSIGDVVQRKSYVLCRNAEEDLRTYFGTVVYIHPHGRYHVVEFRFPNGAVIRESFLGVER